MEETTEEVERINDGLTIFRIADREFRLEIGNFARSPKALRRFTRLYSSALEPGNFAVGVANCVNFVFELRGRGKISPAWAQQNISMPFLEIIFQEMGRQIEILTEKAYN